MEKPAVHEDPVGDQRVEVRVEVEGFIRQHALDLDFVTITKGRPSTLFCTKNDHSHQRAPARRAKDEELLGQLGR